MDDENGMRNAHAPRRQVVKADPDMVQRGADRQVARFRQRQSGVNTGTHP
jgi:hypothetical protein